MSGTAFVTNSLDTLNQTLVGGPISSQYILYANGQGQSYWAPGVSTDNLSTLSTSAAIQYANLSSGVSSLSGLFTSLSTYTISSVNGSIVSTSQSLENNFNVLSNQFVIFSNTTQSEFVGLSNNLTTQVNNIYNSSLAIVYSTIQAISSISSFTNEIGDVRTMSQAAASSLSTAIAVTNASTTSALTTQFNSTIAGAAASTVAYTNSQVSTLSTVIASKDSLNTFSTQINNALLSTSWSFTSTIAQNFSTLFFEFNQFEASSLSTSTWVISTISEIDARVGALEFFSSQISSVTAAQISSYTSPRFSTQDAKLSLYTSTLLNQISSVRFSTLQNTQAISTISTFSYFNTSSLQSQITTLSQGLSTLDYGFSVLTTSSILAGVYDTFLALEAYTVGLINSTINSVTPFKSGLLYSTTLQNTSTATGFWTAFVSSAYLSTISTMIPITTAYVSSLVSSLYSTGSYSLQSSIDSTIFGKTIEFTSTTTSLTDLIVLSSQSQLNSSILSYLSSPAGVALNTFSTQGAQAISTFNGQGLSTLRFQSSIFGSTYNVNQSLVSTLLGRGNSSITTVSQLYSTYNTLYPALYSSMFVSSATLFSTQNVQFVSSLGGYANTLQFVIGSTNASVLSTAGASVSSYMSTLVSTTTGSYNQFIADLLVQTSSIALSSLYTAQTITLTSTNFESQIDPTAFTNFNINITPPLVSGSSNYRIFPTTNLTGIPYRRGVITLNVSTVGASYSNNGGQLCMDVYRWGLPTTVWGSVYPSISNADYMAMYEYTIQSNIMYTNLLNVYPRLRLYGFGLGPSQTYNVFSGTTLQSNYFWRGTPMLLQWNNYTHFPMGVLGAPPYSPEIMIDVFLNGSLYERRGPYDMTVSSLTYNLPNYPPTTANPATTRIRAYIAGKLAEAEEITVQVLLPKFQEVRMTPRPGNFVALQEIQAWADTGVNAFAGTNQVGIYGSVAGSNLALGGSNATFGRLNAVDGNPNTIVLGPTSVGVPDPNAYLQLLPNLTTTTSNISSIKVFNIPSSSNQARGSGDATLEMESTILRANVLIGAIQYYSSIRLTSAAEQTFSF
jgi:hypothetical protein